MDPIHNCPPRFRYRCPKEWDALLPTQDQGVRHCLTCDRDVFRCETSAEFFAHADQGHCVALALKSETEGLDMRVSVGWPEPSPFDSLRAIDAALREYEADDKTAAPEE